MVLYRSSPGFWIPYGEYLHVYAILHLTGELTNGSIGHEHTCCCGSDLWLMISGLARLSCCQDLLHSKLADSKTNTAGCHGAICRGHKQKCV